MVYNVRDVDYTEETHSHQIPVVIINSENSSKVSNCISLQLAAQMLSPVLQQVWGPPPWNETVVQNGSNDMDAQPIEVSIYDQNNRLSPIDVVYDQLKTDRPDVLNNLDPNKQGAESLEFFWNERRTAHWINDNIQNGLNPQLVLIHEGMNQENNHPSTYTVVAWTISGIVGPEHLHMEDGLPKHLNKARKIYQIDTVGKNPNVSRELRLKGEAILYQKMLSDILLHKFIKHNPIIFRTDQVAGIRVMKALQRWGFEATDLGKSTDNPDRKYYQISKIHLTQIMNQLISSNFIYRCVKKPNLMMEKVFQILEADSDILKHINSPENTERMQDAQLDLKVGAVTAASAILASLLLHPSGLYIGLTDGPQIINLIQLYDAMPIAGVAGPIRGLIFALRSFYYSKKYNDKLTPKLITSALSALDGGWILSPLIAYSGTQDPKLSLYNASKNFWDKKIKNLVNVATNKYHKTKEFLYHSAI